MRPSQEIRTRQTREIMRAARHAWRLGRPLTRYIVINFPEPAEGDELVPQRTMTAIRNKCRSWWDHKRKAEPSLGALTDVRVWENKHGILHVNWLVRVPEHLEEEFDKKLDRWLGKVVPDQPAEAVKKTAIYNLNGLLKYVLKGTEQNNADRFGIDPVNQGEVWGRRAAASINLGKVARDRDWQGDSLVHRSWSYRKPSPHASAQEPAPKAA